ncbi:hypothetical protein N7492_004842 [Penicillium capsulatum]|uniref:Mediator of RNA polymerase II transcription subunit 14 n=1 Tax=Penicillium capsulatum TaxID=69766 RepID=A0A9W9IAL4_9EURO|nr:hypothetical protein N7492_004842 [Penicillium capsulatum]KAJ6136049.1 hypothetical protein N7512_001209 [Penicillium capsulatum]
MPGVIMDNANVEGSMRRPGLPEATNGTSNSLGNHEKASQLPISLNGPVHTNGTGQSLKAGDAALAPFELPHITQGFFPLGMLVNRAVQQCWVDLSELITELAAIQVSNEHLPSAVTNGKAPGNQSAENVHKKMRILDFVHAKRAEFIKLLVLSQWSRQAAEVGRLIDIQGFIRTRHQAYTAAVQFVGEMKRDLVRAQVANPDLKTSLEVLSKGRVTTLPDLGYKPPKPLSARATLQKLHKINRLISTRLALYDTVPTPLRKYRVHDGRVTFTVPGEFELDLSIAEEAKASQFFFVDIRFLFSPSSPVPKGRIFDELDAKVNEILHNDGLMGCFSFLHGLVLTNKVNTLFRQASDLARGLWSDALRVEFLHRTLVVQYWPTRTGPKSWLEIGVQRGHRSGETYDTNDKVSRLGLRWMRDGQQANSDAIQFDRDLLSMEHILRSVIAQHTSHILSAAYAAIKRHLLFSSHLLSLRAQLSPTEPGDCFISVQLTASRHLRVSMESLSGAIILSGVPGRPERSEMERSQHKSAVEELLLRVSRLRCSTAVDEIETGTKALGLESVRQRALAIDTRRLFPPNVLRATFFAHPLWDRDWAAVATSSMDGDAWWLVPLRSAKTSRGTPFDATSASSNHPPVAHCVSHHSLFSKRQLDSATCADMIHGLTGILAMYANAQCLADIPNVHLQPSLEELQLNAVFQVPGLHFQYTAMALPEALRMTLPLGLEKGPYLHTNISLTYHGMDRASESCVLVAQGSLRRPIKALVPLVSKADPNLLIQKQGGAFALRLLVPAGRSVVVTLFEQLQRFECVLSILQSLVQKGMEPRSISLSHVLFLYGPDKKFSARFGIDVTDTRPSASTKMAQSLSKAEPLFQLRLGVRFDAPSPHRRIQEPLTVSLNQRFGETGVESVLASMSETFPLLQCLDRIMNLTQSGSSIVHVTVRSPTLYRFHYPFLKACFQLSTRPRQNRTVWLLEDANKVEPGSQVSTTVRESIYNSRGDGWQGMGDGALSVLGKVGNLLSELHRCLGNCPPEPVREQNETQVQNGTANQRSQQGPAVPLAQPPQAEMSAKANVITID